MIKKLYSLFKIGRSLAKADALNYFEEIYNPPLFVTIAFKILGFRINSKELDKSIPVNEKFVNALKELGPTFIKLGQFLGTRPDIVGDTLATDLQKLQDRMPAFSLAQAKETLRSELGEETYGKISNISEPIAAASIAQVHFASLNNNEKQVAIKILRPNIEKIFNQELEALMLFAYLVEMFLPKTRRLKLVEVIHLLKEITSIEMDLRFEAAAANELKNNTSNDPYFKVPSIYWDFTSKRILTLEKVEGIPIRDIEKINAANIDKKELAKSVIQNFLRQAVGDGFFHGDMHQGNLFVDLKGNIIPVDFGIMGRLDKNNRKYLADILYGFIQRDYEKVADVHFKAGLVPNSESKESFSQALRSIGEPIFGQSIKNISAGKLLAQLFEITERFNMATQPQLLLLQKNMVVVEGVARSLDEEANIWDISKPILEGWLTREISPKAKLEQAIGTAGEVLDRLPEIPKLMDQATRALELFVAKSTSINTDPVISKNLEIEKNKLKNEKNSFIIKILIVAIIALLIFK
jgi:ubiquinone biosynthesis protein